MKTNLELYKVFYEVLDTSEYGVPQIRKRVFFIGIKKGIQICMPDPIL